MLFLLTIVGKEKDMYNKTLYLIAAFGFLGMTESTWASGLCVRCSCDIRVTKEENGQAGTGTMTLEYYNVKRPGVEDSAACQGWCESNALNWAANQPGVKSVGALVSTQVLGRFPPRMGESCPD